MKLSINLLFLFILVQLSTPSVAMEDDSKLDSSKVVRKNSTSSDHSTGLSKTSSPSVSPLFASSNSVSSTPMSPRSLSPKSSKKAIGNLFSAQLIYVEKTKRNYNQVLYSHASWHNKCAEIENSKVKRDHNQVLYSYASWHTKHEDELATQRNTIDELEYLLADKEETISQLQKQVAALTINKL